MKKKKLNLAIVLLLGVLVVPPTLIAGEPVGYWSFDDCSATDSSGNQHDGIIHNNPECVSGVSGKALRFNGVDNWIEIPFTSGLAGTVMTTSVWIYKAEDIKGVVLEKIDRINRNGNNYGTGVSNKSIHIRTEDARNDNDYGAGYSFTDEEGWVHAVQVLTQQDMKLYVNGCLVAERELPQGFIPYMGNAPLQIGGVPLSNHGNKANGFYRGLIDEISVYNQTLSESEIQELYSSKTTAIPKCKLNVCQLYGVHDEGLNDSQLFTVDPANDFAVNALGDFHENYDLEALDIHPQTGELFAASGDDTNKKGHLYKVDQKGELDDLGYTGCEEVDGLSFHPDGTLWGWGQDCGLLTINTTTGEANVVVEYSGEVEDLTWNTAGTILYGVENLHGNHDPDSHDPLDHEGGQALLAYTPSTGILEKKCQSLINSLEQEIEALDTLPDDTLILGFHGNTDLTLGVIDVTTCQIIAEEEISTNYNDVEGIAWPNCQ